MAVTGQHRPALGDITNTPSKYAEPANKATHTTVEYKKIKACLGKCGVLYSCFRRLYSHWPLFSHTENQTSSTTQTEPSAALKQHHPPTKAGRKENRTRCTTRANGDGKRYNTRANGVRKRWIRLGNLEEVLIQVPIGEIGLCDDDVAGPET